MDNTNEITKRKSTYKPLSELNLCDDFLFSQTMRDTEILKPLLEEILNIKISHINIVEPEKTMEVAYDAHGIRLDVYAADSDNRRFSVEMQTKDTYNIPKRSRYYHSVMDVDELLKGTNYNKLKDNYVIFICTFNLFDEGLHQYNFASFCRQKPELDLGDSRETIILSTEGTENDVSADLLAFLKYVKSSTDETAESLDSELVNKIHNKVKNVKHNHAMEVEYLKFEELMKESRQEGYDDGISAGIELGEQRGEKRGIDIGRNEIITAIQRLKKGAAPQELLADGYPQELIDAALTCL
jgi:predicted transposase/invertase (TIGR01784 family)